MAYAIVIKGPVRRERPDGEGFREATSGDRSKIKPEVSLVVFVECTSCQEVHSASEVLTGWLDKRQEDLRAPASALMVHLAPSSLVASGAYLTKWLQVPGVAHFRHICACREGEPAGMASAHAQREAVWSSGGSARSSSVQDGEAGVITHFGAYVRQNIRLHAVEPLLYPLLLPASCSPCLGSLPLSQDELGGLGGDHRTHRTAQMRPQPIEQESCRPGADREGAMAASAEVDTAVVHVDVAHAEHLRPLGRVAVFPAFKIESDEGACVDAARLLAARRQEAGPHLISGGFLEAYGRGGGGAAAEGLRVAAPLANREEIPIDDDSEEDSAAASEDTTTSYPAEGVRESGSGAAQRGGVAGKHACSEVAGVDTGSGGSALSSMHGVYVHPLASHIMVLGTGAAAPSKLRSCSGLLLNVAHDESRWVD